MNLSRIYIKFITTTTIILLCFNILPAHSLPVTSKPIENTPEHLAWEAWLMLPPSPNGRTRKITPKSIFILPNTSIGNSDGNSGNNLGIQPQAQVQCPPGYREDNSKCISVISVNHQELVVQQLSSLLSNQENSDNPGLSTTYEEYDYDNYDTPMSFDSDNLPGTSITYSNNGPTDNHNAEQPLKINFSLDKFGALDKFVNNINLDSMEKSEEVKNGQPFVLPTTTDSASLISVPQKIDEDIMAAASTTSAMTDKSNSAIKIIKHSTATPPMNLMNTTSIENSTFDAVTTHTSTESFIIQMNLSDDENDYDESTTISPVYNTSSTTFMILSSAETELDDSNFTKDDMNSTNDMNDNLELVTEISEIQKNIEDNLAEESFVIDKHTKENTTVTLIDETTEEFIEGSTNRNELEYTTTIEPTLDIISKETDYVMPKKTPELYALKTVSEGTNRGTDIPKKEVPLNEHDSDSATELIENDKRFFYHHTGSSTLSDLNHLNSKATNPTTTQNSDARDIQEQLRIINMIVEENKRKQEQQRPSKIRFPDDIKASHLQREGLRADLVRFPEVTSPTVISSSSSSPSHFSFQTNNFDKTKFDPNKFLFHRKFFQPITTTPPLPSSITETENGKTKPFWWLPSGWEADKNEEKPLLISFWGRPSSQQAPSTQILTSTNYDATTTSGYRENSRYPTDNLYREISAQEVYKVLGAARQWKHSSKR